ncbi:hypothetical protein D3C76_945020 [compost metagenome]
MGQGRVTEQVIGEAITQVQQARRAGGVLVQVAGVIHAGTSVARPGGRTVGGKRSAAKRCIAIDPGAFLLIGAANPGGEIQAFAQVPGALGKQGETVGVDMAFADAADIGQRLGWRTVPDVGLGAVEQEGFVIQVGAEVVGTHHVVEEATAGRGQAELLRVLFISHRYSRVVKSRHVQAVIVARGEIPPAIGGDRG